MNQKKKQYFTLEFKQNAAQLVISKGYHYTDAAKSLGVSVSALRKWVHAENGKKEKINSPQLNLGEREELLRLRKENSRLKMEREILKKAAVFFAQDHG